MDSKLEQNKITLEINLTLKDYKKFTSGITFGNVAIQAFTTLAIITFIYFIYLSIQVLNKGGTIPMPVLSICLGLSVFPFIMIYSANEMAKKIYSNNKQLSQTLSYVITNYGISLSSTNSYKSVKWEEVFKVIELKEYFVVFTSVTIEESFVLPKRYFLEKDQIILFKQIVSQNLEKKRLKLSS